MQIDWHAVEAIGTWMASIATVFAVWVALRLQRRHEERVRPRLAVKLQPDSPDCLRYQPPEFASASTGPRSGNVLEREELWLRVAVENFGEIAAKNVQVRLVSILRERDVVPESRSSLWFKAASLNSTSVNLLPRRIKQYFDVAFVRHCISPDDQVSFHLTIVKPELEPWPAEKKRIEEDKADNKLEIGWRYVVHIVALSDNADACPFIFAITLNPRRDHASLPGTKLGEGGLTALLLVESDLRQTSY